MSQTPHSIIISASFPSGLSRLLRIFYCAIRKYFSFLQKKSNKTVAKEFMLLSYASQIHIIYAVLFRTILLLFHSMPHSVVSVAPNCGKFLSHLGIYCLLNAFLTCIQKLVYLLVDTSTLTKNKM